MITESTTNETAVRLRAFAADLERLILTYEEKVATKDAIISRLEYLFDDVDLTKMVYDFVVLGHLSYANQLHERFAPIALEKEKITLSPPA